MEIIKKRITNAFNLTFDLVNNFKEEDLKLKLNNLPSNTIGQQIWCIIGARESYLNAIINEKWVGFNCSLKDTSSKELILKCLIKSSEDYLKFFNNQILNEVQTEYLIVLLEHEILHHGQLIRYIYGNNLTFPKSWNDRYTV